MNLFRVLFYSMLFIASVICRTRVNSPPTIDQKSLAIIFDGTQSMKPDLVQLRIAVRKIVEEFSSFEHNPIYNYILVVFRDPVNEVPKSTQNPEVFLKTLDEIEIRGGGDCPEMSLSGLEAAMKYALPNSIAYVITDATAKDHYKYKETLNIMKKKQITVNFLMTGDCDARDEIGYKVYNKLARLSNSQVFHVETEGIENVLLSLRSSMKDTYVPTRLRRSVSAGKSHMPLLVDSTMSDIDIRLSGENPNLLIKNPFNEIVTGDDLTLENVKIVNIKNPMPGKWNVEAESSSEYTVQMGSNSDLKIKFGFSSRIPNKHEETTVQPMKGSKNILSFFVQDPSKIRYLSNATLGLENDEEIADYSKRERREIKTNKEIKLKLTKVSGNVYVSEPFVIPKEMFKIQLNGVDSNGNEVQRLVSTAIETIEPSAPEVFISTTKYKIERHEKLSLKCIVKSLIPVNLQWYYQDKMIKKINSSQSNECEVIISFAQESNAERFVCKAVNDKGSADNHIDIEIKGGKLMSTTEESNTDTYDEESTDNHIDIETQEGDVMLTTKESNAYTTDYKAVNDESTETTINFVTSESIAFKMNTSKCSTISFQTYLILLSSLFVFMY